MTICLSFFCICLFLIISFLILFNNICSENVKIPTIIKTISINSTINCCINTSVNILSLATEAISSSLISFYPLVFLINGVSNPDESNIKESSSFILLSWKLDLEYNKLNPSVFMLTPLGISLPDNFCKIKRFSFFIISYNTNY